MTLVRTFTNRGKRALELSELKPNGVYAVRFVLTPELAHEWNVNGLEQWGLVMLDSNCKVRRHWNVTQPNAWSTAEVDCASLNLFKTSTMERQFAATAEEEESLTIKCRQMAARMADMQHKLNDIEGSRWHQVAERLRNLF